MKATVLWSGEAADLRDAVVQAVASGADLSGAHLSGADLSGADLLGAHLSGAHLSGANLSGADLSGADLSWANLSRADLSRANLSWTNLSWAHLAGAHLSGADLSRTNLSWAHLSGANGIDPARCTPLLMLRDQPGLIHAYKLVTADGVGPFQGGITYRIGESYEVADANTDPGEQCGSGIHVATLDWCLREWRAGYRVLVVSFLAADIAAIPTATDGKFRLWRATVVGEKDITALVMPVAEVVRNTMSHIWSAPDDHESEPRWFRVVGNLALAIMLAIMVGYSLYVVAIWLTGGDV